LQHDVATPLLLAFLGKKSCINPCCPIKPRAGIRIVPARPSQQKHKSLQPR
jgi:hypothetical protein